MYFLFYENLLKKYIVQLFYSISIPLKIRQKMIFLLHIIGQTVQYRCYLTVELSLFNHFQSFTRTVYMIFQKSTHYLFQSTLQNTILNIIEMEKEIYLTEAVYSTDTNDFAPPIKEKSIQTPFQSRPQTAKVNSKKMSNKFMPESYYDDKKVKPGITLYKLILQIEERRANGEYSGPTLNLNIPETVLLNDNSNSLIYTEEGTVKVQPFVTNQAFIKKIEQQRSESIYPYVLHSSISGVNFNQSILMNTEVIGSKIIPRSEGFICRKFIHPYASTPNVLRLYYLAKGTRQLKKNYGYKLIHSRSINEDMFKKKHRLLHNFIVNSQMEDTYSVTLVAGKALQTCISMADSFVQYLQKGVFVKVSEIVMDFIIDQNKQAWLHQIKSVKSKNLTKLWDIGNSEELQLLTQKSNSSHICKLCGMTYSRQQMEKIVTNKLIWQLIAHLKSRGIPFKPPSHLKKQGLSYICDICYEVVVAEHKLITIQRQFSELLNLQTTVNKRIHSTSSQLNSLVQTNPDCTGSKFKAWRLFFYIEKIKHFEHSTLNRNFTINLQMKFNNLREQFTKVVCGDNPEHSNSKSRFSSTVRVQSAVEKKSPTHKLEHSILRKLSQSRFQNNKTIQTMTTMASKVAPILTPSKQSYSLQKVKVYMFYTKDTLSTSMFANTELQFNLSIGEEKFNGKSATMQALKNRDTCQRHSSQIFLFDENMKYCNLQLTVGLICDGEVDGDSAIFQGNDGIYFTQKPIGVCKPLPDEWMEVFTKGQSFPSQTISRDLPQFKPEPIPSNLRSKESPLLKNSIIR